VIATSPEYKTKVLERSQTWLPSVTVDFSDFNLDNSITSSVWQPDNTNDGDQMANGRELATYRWWYWDSFQWGDHLRETSTSDKEKSAVSVQRSFHDSTFRQYSGKPSGYSPMAGFTCASLPIDYPTFILSFSPRSIVALKTAFEFQLQQWGVDFDYILTESDGTEHTYSVTGWSSWRREVEITPVGDVVLMAIRITKWSVANAQAKVMELYTSIQRVFAGDDLLSFSVQEEVEQSQPTTPIGNISANALDITFLNLNAEFDNDSEDSILAGSVTDNRRVKPFLQIAGATDLIPMGEFYTKSWNINNREMTASASCVDIIGLMGEKTYTQSKFITPGVDQDFEYTTTADFDGFSLVNCDTAGDRLTPGDGVLYDADPTPVTFSGFGVASYSSLASWAQSTATATRSISFDYTPGTTSVVTLAVNELIPSDGNINYYINGTLVSGPFYIQPDSNDTTQNLTLEIEFVYASTKPVLYDITLTIAESVSLGSLANKILLDYDTETDLLQGRWTIADEYEEYEVPVAYLPLDTYRENLRYIAQAAGGRVYQDRQGFVRMITTQAMSTPVKTWDNSTLFDESKPVNPRAVFNRVEIIINEHVKGTSGEVAKVAIQLATGQTQSYEVKVKAIAAETYTYSGLPGGVTVANEVEYTWGVTFDIVNASGTDQAFDLVVNAESWSVEGNRRIVVDDTDSIRQSGVLTLEIDNYLIQSAEYANTLGQRLIQAYGNQRRTANLDALPDPSIIVGDTVYSNSRMYVVESNNISIASGELIQIVKVSR